MKIADLQPGDTFILEGRSFRCHLVEQVNTKSGQWVWIETTTGTVLHEHGDTFVEVKGK